MSALSAGDTKTVRGLAVRQDPAREVCFTIVDLHQDVPDSGGMTEEARRQRLHREYNQEIQTIEIAALTLVDFPDAPWELKMELARQCWDEVRHSRLLYRRLLAYGGWKGMYPIANLDWSLVMMIDSLAGRLAVQHRTFEAGSLDIESQIIPVFRELGDHETADAMEAIEADEIQHVRFANLWLKRMTDGQPRTVLEIAAAMTWLKKVVAATGGMSPHEIATDADSRRLAGFSTAEVAEVQRLERLGVSAPAPAPPSPNGD
jgi:uncharacterized ferritin-like protein (DUF455 family)